VFKLEKNTNWQHLKVTEYQHNTFEKYFWKAGFLIFRKAQFFAGFDRSL